MDGETDGGDYNIPFAFLKKHGDNNFQLHTLISRPGLMFTYVISTYSHLMIQILKS